MDDAVAAVSRFGLGARGDELGDAEKHPRDWVKAQLVSDPRLPDVLAGLPSTEDTLRLGAAARAGGESDKDAFRKQMRAQYVTEAAARCSARATSDRPVVERLVAFFANHFAVSVGKRQVVGYAGGFEREAIRPRVLGRFVDLLVAVVRHPAMLLYLDQAQSTGPHSKVGQKRDQGLNENLAREILELHTLGVDGGYAQTDVEAFARALTGWSLGSPDEGDEDGFRFRPNRHEPGAVTLLGKRYPDDGEAQALAILHDLALHPSTARFVCTKLARHFVSDAPPAALIEAMIGTFASSGGHLGHTLVTLVEHDLAWSGDARKLRTPDDLVTAAARAVGAGEAANAGDALAKSVERLGQRVWDVPSPAGWPDDTVSWSGPGAVLDRVEWAEDASARVGEHLDATELVDRVLGARASARTRAAIAVANGAAGGGARGVALLLACPEFQWR